MIFIFGLPFVAEPAANSCFHEQERKGPFADSDAAAMDPYLQYNDIHAEYSNLLWNPILELTTIFILWNVMNKFINLPTTTGPLSTNQAIDLASYIQFTRIFIHQTHSCRVRELKFPGYVLCSKGMAHPSLRDTRS